MQKRARSKRAKLYTLTSCAFLHFCERIFCNQKRKVRTVQVLVFQRFDDVFDARRGLSEEFCFSI